MNTTATAEELSLQLWKWLTLHPKTKTLLLITALCTICNFINIETALAEDGGQSVKTMYLPVDHITDSHGVPISSYVQLPLDYGNATHPMRSARAFVISLLWSIYVMATFIMISTVDFIVGLSWLDWILSPLILLANSVQVTTAKLIIIPTALTLSALAGAILWMRGHKSTALIEVSVAVLISAFAASPIANPINYFTGNNGAIQQSAEYGTEIGNVLTSNEENTNASPISAPIIDVTLRTPAQVLSFGKKLDGECEVTFNEKATAGEEPEDIRKAINKCDDVAKANNETDSLIVLAFFFVFAVGFVGLWLIVLVLLFFILKDALFAALNAINVIWRFPLAVMPWGTRYGLYNSFSQMSLNVAVVGISIAVTAIYLWLYARFTELTGGTFMIYQNFILGVIALAMAYTLFKMKKSGKNLGQQLSKRLSQLGITRGPSTREPSKLASGVKSIVKTAGGYYAMNRGFTRSGTATSLARVGAAAVTGGTSAVATTIATTAGAAFAQNMGAAATQQRLEANKSRAALQPSYRNGDGTIPMPAKQENKAPQPGTIDTTKSTKEIELAKKPAPAPAKNPTPNPGRPAPDTTIAPGRYGNVRLDHEGKPHTIKPVEGEIVDIPDSKLRTLKLLDSYDASSSRTQPRRFTHN